MFHAHGPGREEIAVTKRTRARRTRPSVGYVRRSTDRQEQSLGDQRRVIEAYAEEASYDLLDWYADDAISGAGADDRAAFLRMIHDAQQPGCPFKYVLVYDVKRFGRLDNDETGHYRYLLRKAGVEVIYVAENFSGDDTDDLLLPVKQWQARQELRDLSKVTIRGLLTKVDGGWWMGGVPPYGYDLAYCNAAREFLMIVRYMPDGSKQVLDENGVLQRTLRRGDKLRVSKQDRARLVPSAPERVKVLQEIFRLYVRDGYGYKKIADVFNERGIPSPRNGKWSKMHSKHWAMTSIRDILMNPAYTGDAVWNRRSLAKFYRISGGGAVAAPKIRQRAIEVNSEDDWIVHEDAHPALIPREVFDEAQRLRKERTKRVTHAYRSGRGAKSNYLLSGLIACERCGHRWQGYTTKGGKKRKDGSRSVNEYYACGGYVMKGNSVCKRDIIQRDVIEGLVIGTIRENIRRLTDAAEPTELRELLRDYFGVTGEGAPEELARLREEHDEIRIKINNILDNITATNREFADQRIAELKKDLPRVEARIEELERSTAPQVDLDLAVREMTELLRDFGQVMEEGSIDERRRAVRAFVKEIRLDPESYEGQAQVFVLPTLTPTARTAHANSDSSFHLVAGAPVVVEKKRPGFVVDFTWRIDAARAKRSRPRVFDVSRCAA
jgi:DNA invertase Pin-like site-specific DNA recombinase